MSDGTMNVALLNLPGNVPGWLPSEPFHGLVHFGMWVDDLDEAKKQGREGGWLLYQGPKVDNPNAFYEVKYKDPIGSCSTSPIRAGAVRSRKWPRRRKGRRR